MAKKGSFFGRLFVAGGLAAAGTLLYRKHKDTIQGFLQELTEEPAQYDEAVVVDVTPDPAETEAEVDIVIDRTGDDGAAEG